MSKIISVTLLLLVVVGAGLYIWMKQPLRGSGKQNIVANLNDWEVYRNGQYGFEVKYPNSSSLNETKVMACFSPETFLGVPNNLIEEAKNKLGGGYLLGACFSVHKIDNPNSLSVTDWMGVNRSDIIKSADSQQDIVFKDVPALFLEREDKGINRGQFGYLESTIYFFHKGLLFSITSIAPPKNPSEEWRAHPYYQYLEKSVPVTQAIIDSFRFVD